MTSDVLILDSRSPRFARGEKRQGQCVLSVRRKLDLGDVRLYDRTGSEIVLNEAAMNGVLDRLRDEHGLKLAELSIVLPHAVTWYHYLEVEDLPRQINEAYEFVMWRIQKIIPISREQAELRLQVLSKSPERQVLLVAVTFKTFIMAIEGCLQSRGLVAPVITTPTLAFMNVFDGQLPPDGLAVWLRERDYSMIRFVGGMPISIREVDRPITLGRIEPELFSFNASLGETAASVPADAPVFFDELQREGLPEFFPEGSTALPLSALSMPSGDEDGGEGFSLMVSALGVIE